MQPDVVELALVDRDQRLGHAVDEGSMPMKPVRGCALRLRDQMLAAAEADFQPHLVDGMSEQRAQIGGRRLAQIEREPRQQRRRTARPAAARSGWPLRRPKKARCGFESTLGVMTVQSACGNHIRASTAHATGLGPRFAEIEQLSDAISPRS